MLNSGPYTFAHFDPVEELAKPTGRSILDSMSRVLQGLRENGRSDYDDCVVQAFKKELNFCADDAELYAQAFYGEPRSGEFRRCELEREAKKVDRVSAGLDIIKEEAVQLIRLARDGDRM